MLAKLEERNKQIKVQVLPELHRRIKVKASWEAKTVTTYVTELLEREVAEDQKK